MWLLFYSTFCRYDGEVREIVICYYKLFVLCIYIGFTHDHTECTSWP